ncbi:class I SAM-dependent methyltransferase [Flaviaesturariibacter amylovorans]|uniref:Class I SAM-dependent methyltransferase n=1 Tax=Flaviaesturariibacter amylovorans TaxID=1084520 RepID=A0ABP8HPU3_9BACT
MKQLLKRLYFALRPQDRVIVMDYSIPPKAIYNKERPHRALFDMIAANDGQYRALMEKALSLQQHFVGIKEQAQETDAAQPAWNNNFVPGLDIILLYTLLTDLKPKRYVEIGSGTTTKTALKARTEQKLDFTITCVDPSPRREIKAIADTWHPSLVQHHTLETFKALEAGDILFFDGTHTLVPNSDVMWFFMEVLPVLKPGVIVQVHDIYLPYDYPQFMLDRYYSENYILGALLLNNPEKYTVIAPNYYISEQAQLAKILDPLWAAPNLRNVERHGGSFWFRIN